MPTDEITNLNGSFAVPFTMTIKTIVISNQDCDYGEWNALFKISGSGLDKHSDRNHQSWVFLNYPKNTLSLTECPKNYSSESEAPKNTLQKHDSLDKS